MSLPGLCIYVPWFGSQNDTSLNDDNHKKKCTVLFCAKIACMSAL